MPSVNSFMDPRNLECLEAESVSSTYTMLLLLTGLATATYLFAKFAESNNHLNYENRFARMLTGIFMFIARVFHTSNKDLDFSNVNNKLVVLGPHRTALEAIAFTSKIKEGTPPRFFTTTSYNAIPCIASLLKISKAIPIDSSLAKLDGKSANAAALEQASNILSNKGCVALFPQGNYAKIGQEPPKIYNGAAKLALKNNIPIHVIRLDGFWSLENPIIPLFIRNNSYYRTLFCAFHMNNMRATLCSMIDFHLKPENASLSDEEKIEEICAQLYAYYRHTQELTAQQIAQIPIEISSKQHLLIWRNRVQREDIAKQLVQLKNDSTKLEESTLLSMQPRLMR